MQPEESSPTAAAARPAAARVLPAALVQVRPRSRLLFDACHTGVVLRALALALVPAALLALFGAGSASEWLGEFAQLVGVVLPPTLLWLLLCCALRGWLDRQAASVQWGVVLTAGGLCGSLGYLLYGALALQPPGPLSGLAAVLCGVAAAALLTSVLILRQRASQPAATVARLAELQSRIRPHFLFNTLNSAIALVRQDPDAAERMLEDLSDLFHHALKDAASISSLEREIALARQYLRIEAMRFGPRLRVAFSVDAAALAASVPPLLLQPLVENAVKHGVEPSVEGGDVHVLVRRRGDQVHVIISNTVPSPRQLQAAASRAGNGMALANVRARLRLMHDVQADFKSRVREGRYEVVLSIPARPLRGHDAD